MSMDVKKVSSLVTFMKEQGIKCLELDGLKIELYPKYKTKPKEFTGELKVERPIQASEEEQKKTEEELLYWSAGA